MSDKAKIAELEREVADLKGEIAALKLLLPANKQASPRREEQQVRITTPPLARVDLPTEDEFRRLMAIVHRRYPMLAPREDPQDYVKQFRAAFIRLAHIGRRDALDGQRALGQAYVSRASGRHQARWALSKLLPAWDARRPKAPPSKARASAAELIMLR